MFYSFKLYFRDRWIGMPLLAVLGIQVFLWWYLLSHIKPTDEQIFLHYNIIFGVDLIGSWWKIFYLPAGGLLVTAINYALSWFRYDEDRVFARTLSLWTLMVNILLFISVWLIASLNI